MVGLHQRVKRRFGIWLRPDRWALVSFLYRIDSSNPEAFSQNNPKRVESKVHILFWKHTFPCGKISAFEQGVLKDTLNTTECRNDVHTIIIELPQFTIMALRSPPERITISVTLISINKIRWFQTYCFSNWYCFQSVRTRQPRS